MLLWIHDTRWEAKLISAKFLMLGDDLSVWDFLSSMTFPWLLMIFQSSMTFHDFSRKLYFSRFSRPCGNPESWYIQIHHKISNTSRTNSPNSNVSRLVWSCICPSYWCQVLRREWRCSWSSAERRCSNYIWVIDKSIARYGASYIRDLTVHLHVSSKTIQHGKI